MRLALLMSCLMWAASIYAVCMLTGCTRGGQIVIGYNPVSGIDHRQTFDEAATVAYEERRGGRQS